MGAFWQRITQLNIAEGDLSYMNETCNSILTKNNTLIEIDRGWEGIPESLVINLILCIVSNRICFVFDTYIIVGFRLLDYFLSS